MLWHLLSTIFDLCVHFSEKLKRVSFVCLDRNQHNKKESVITFLQKCHEFKVLLYKNLYLIAKNVIFRFYRYYD